MSFTLADAFLLPLIHYMRLMPESSEMVKASPHLCRLVRPRRRAAQRQGDRTAADARPGLSRAHHDKTVTVGRSCRRANIIGACRRSKDA